MCANIDRGLCRAGFCGNVRCWWQRSRSGAGRGRKPLDVCGLWVASHLLVHRTAVVDARLRLLMRTDIWGYAWTLNKHGNAWTLNKCCWLCGRHLQWIKRCAGFCERLLFCEPWFPWFSWRGSSLERVPGGKFYFWHRCLSIRIVYICRCMSGHFYSAFYETVRPWSLKMWCGAHVD